MTNFRDAFPYLLPSWLTAEDGERVVGSLAVVKDLFAERARQGLLARYPSYAPRSALPHLGRDRKIVRGINEIADTFRDRLLRYLDDHQTRGNPFALMGQLRAYCNADVRIRTVDRRGNWYTRDRDGTLSYVLKAGNWNWDGKAATLWSRFWVIIYPTAAGEPWAATPGAIGDAGLWGGVFGAPGYTIGTTATPEQIASLRSLVREWQPDGTRCEWIIIAFDDASFDPTAPGPDGTWALFGKDDGAGNWVSGRLGTARYIKGVDGAEVTL